MTLDDILVEHSVQFDGVHLRIRRRDGDNVQLTWSEMQMLKDYVAGPDTEMYELYPRAEDVVDEVPIRHLWVCEGLSRMGSRGAL